MPRDRGLNIQTVTLKGAGIERTLHYVVNENINYYDYFLSSTDFCSKNYLHFLRLAAGEYEVKITAKGFRPSVKTNKVKPGRPANIQAVELVVEK